jgi:hypothetical protein
VVIGDRDDDVMFFTSVIDHSGNGKMTLRVFVLVMERLRAVICTYI